jgi:hypothetical protein
LLLAVQRLAQCVGTDVGQGSGNVRRTQVQLASALGFVKNLR